MISEWTNNKPFERETYKQKCINFCISSEITENKPILYFGEVQPNNKDINYILVFNVLRVVFASCCAAEGYLNTNFGNKVQESRHISIYYRP